MKRFFLALIAVAAISLVAFKPTEVKKPAEVKAVKGKKQIIQLAMQECFFSRAEAEAWGRGQVEYIHATYPMARSPKSQVQGFMGGPYHADYWCALVTTYIEI